MLKVSLPLSPSVAIFILNAPLLKYFFSTHPLTLNNTLDSFSFTYLIRYFRYGSTSGKLTYPKRFSDIDIFSLDYIHRGDSVHDVGSSTGVTSIEFFKSIVSSGKDVNFSFSDKYLFLRYDAVTSSLYDSNNNFINCIFCGILVDSYLSTFFFVSRLLRVFISRRRTHFPSNDFHLISLLNPEIRSLADQHNIDYFEYDIFTTSAKRYHFVRCMNLLNPSYFSYSKIRSALLNLKSMLYERGYLLIGRTSSDGVNNASLFLLDGSKFLLVADCNSGSEISNLILSL